MALYSDFASHRARQIAADVVAVVVLILSIMSGVAVHAFIATFASLWGTLEKAGTGFEQTMIEIGDNLASIPLIGSGIRAPFDSASSAGESIAHAGRAGQSVIESIAVTAGIGVALLPIGLLLILWLWPRVRFARRAAETRALLALEDGETLLALRALDSATASQLSAISPRPVQDWRSGVESVTRGLAALTARDAGVRIDLTESVRRV